MKNYKALIYDIDGTILNTLEMNMIPLLKIIKEELNEDWEYKDVLKFGSYPGIKVMEELGIKEIEETYARWVRYVNEYEFGAVPFEGIITLLKQTSQCGVIQAVVSSKTHDQYQIDMIDSGLDTYMTTCVLQEDTTNHKPHPAPLLKCLEKLDCNASEVVYIGDSLADYLAAKAANIDFIYAKWGSVSDKGITHPRYAFDNPLEILKII
ncbi:MAG: HAD-IA family hydrolase [Erysipelothrix sp.]